MGDAGPSCKEGLPQSGEEPQQVGVTILELRFFSCRYIVKQAEEDFGALFCGVQTFKGSYCKGHHRICYKGFPKTKL